MLSEFHVSGRAGDHLHGGVHHGDVHQDPGAGLHAAQGQLHEEPLELHGLLCRDLRVGNSRNYVYGCCCCWFWHCWYNLFDISGVWLHSALYLQCNVDINPREQVTQTRPECPSVARDWRLKCNLMQTDWPWSGSSKVASATKNNEYKNNKSNKSLFLYLIF